MNRDIQEGNTRYWTDGKNEGYEILKDGKWISCTKHDYSMSHVAHRRIIAVPVTEVERDNRDNPLINAARGRDASGINEDELDDICNKAADEIELLQSQLTAEREMSARLAEALDEVQFLAGNHMSDQTKKKVDNILTEFNNHLNNMENKNQRVIDYKFKLTGIAFEVVDEVMRAKNIFPNNFVNQHEAYAVILEEVDELWDEIKKNQKVYDLPAQRKEAIQAAAMLFRLLTELLYDHKI